MEELSSQEREPDFDRAMTQFLQVYHFLASESVVYLLPAPGDCALQDVVFTANIGAALTHVPQRNIVVVSNFTSEPRVRESRPVIEQRRVRDPIADLDGHGLCLLCSGFFTACGTRTIARPGGRCNGGQALRRGTEAPVGKRRRRARDARPQAWAPDLRPLTRPPSGAGGGFSVPAPISSARPGQPRRGRSGIHA